MADGALRGWLADPRAVFVVVTVTTNLLMLGRSYVAMLTLDERGLGTVTLVQTIILFVSTLQLGMLQGGYRLLCNGEAEDRAGINNLLYCLLAGISLLTIFVTLAALLAGTQPVVALLGMCGAVIGVMTLNRNWVANQLIAAQSLGQLNRLTLWTTILSLLPLAAAPIAPLEAILASIGLQPLLFIVLGLARTPMLRPTALRIDAALATRVLAAGFTLFVAGMLLQVNVLIERWFVTTALGIEVLGRLYLLTLFVTLFQLVPNALDAIFLPRLVRANASRDASTVKSTLRTFLLIIVAYCLTVIVLTVWAARPILQLLLPERAADLGYVLVALPGMILFAVSGPFAIVFNVLVQYRALFLAYGASTIATIIGIGLAVAGPLSLDADGVVALRALAQATTAVLLVAGWAWITRAHAQFRFL